MAASVEVRRSTSRIASPFTSSHSAARYSLQPTDEQLALAYKRPFSSADEVKRGRKRRFAKYESDEEDSEDDRERIAAAREALRNAKSHAASLRPSLPRPFPHHSHTPTNVLQQLMSNRAQTAGKPLHTFRRNTYAHRFGKMRLLREIDTFDPSARQADVLLPQKRSRIVEIVAMEGLAFILTHAGACIAYDIASWTKLCYLNIIHDEVIRSLFWNKTAKAIITVSVYRRDEFTSLRCRSTSFDAVRAGKPDQGVFLFPSEALQWPGFVEFDDVNRRVLTYSATTKLYKVWSLSKYETLFQIHNPLVEEVKISPGILLLIMQKDRQRCVQPLQILSMETGEMIASIDHPIVRGRKVEFIEQFNERILIKQRTLPLHIIDVQTRSKKSIDQADFPVPSAFIFLYENRIFLTFCGREIGVWNFNGERVAEMEDHVNWFFECNTNNIYINTEQDLLISYCLTHAQKEASRNRDSDERAWLKARKGSGCINFTSILTGRCVAKVEKRRRMKYPFRLLTPKQQHAVLHSRATTAQTMDSTHSSLSDPSFAHLPHTMFDIPVTAMQQMNDSKNNDGDKENDHDHDVEMGSAPSLDMGRQRHQAGQAGDHAAGHGQPQTTQAAGHVQQQQGIEQQSPTSPPPEFPFDVDDEDEEPPTLTRAHVLAAEDSEGEGEGDGVAGAAVNLNEQNDDSPPPPESVVLSDDSSEEEGAWDDAEAIILDDHASTPIFPSGLHTQQEFDQRPKPPSHQVPDDDMDDEELHTIEDYRRYNRIVRNHNRALRGITALYYNESRNEVYTGNKNGFFHVWGHGLGMDT